MQYVDIERKDNELIITLQEDVEEVTFEQLFEDLFWDDMYHESFGTEWNYITHENSNTVYMLDDYGWNCFRELNDTGQTKVPASPDTYKDYAEGDV